MDSIDPELRGAEEEQTPATTTDTAAEAYAYADAQSSEANTAGQISHQISQSLAAEGLPYYGAQDLASVPPTYQPINFAPHEPRRRPRSCESCRGLKVKCEPNDAGEGPCKRCAKAGRECLYTESSGRRKKKQDNKVAELEKKVSGLTAALLARHGAEASDSLVFDESSVLQNGSDGEVSTSKRRRSEFERDNDAIPLRPAKHQALSSRLDATQLLALAKEPIMKDFCTNLKSLESWFKEHIETKTEDTKNGVKQNDEIKGSTANKSKNAPTAPMGSTPLDLLSQVASNEKPTSQEKQIQNQFYSPYADANQDAAGYYDRQDSNPLLELLHTEFGSRNTLVLDFLNAFINSNTKD